MVTVDTVKLNNDINAFNSMLLARHKLLGGRLPVIVKRQAGFLCRALINMTPPKDRKKLAEKIKQRVTGKFSTLSSSTIANIPIEKQGKGPVRWVAYNKWALYGTTQTRDLSKASVDELYQFYVTDGSNRNGSVKVGKRGRQKVYITSKVVTKKTTVNQLVSKIVRHIGRMKAGWSIGWEDCGKPGRPLPQWIERHAGKSNGARGYSIDGLGVPGAPEFTVANTAAGVSESKAAYYLSEALRERTNEMMGDTLFAIQQPDKWSEREARATAKMEQE